MNGFDKLLTDAINDLDVEILGIKWQKKITPIYSYVVTIASHHVEVGIDERRPFVRIDNKESWTKKTEQEIVKALQLVPMHSDFVYPWAKELERNRRPSSPEYIIPPLEDVLLTAVMPHLKILK